MKTLFEIITLAGVYQLLTLSSLENCKKSFIYIVNWTERIIKVTDIHNILFSFSINSGLDVQPGPTFLLIQVWMFSLVPTFLLIQVWMFSLVPTFLLIQVWMFNLVPTFLLIQVWMFSLVPTFPLIQVWMFNLVPTFPPLPCTFQVKDFWNSKVIQPSDLKGLFTTFTKFHRDSIGCKFHVKWRFLQKESNSIGFISIYCSFLPYLSFLRTCMTFAR